MIGRRTLALLAVGVGVATTLAAAAAHAHGEPCTALLGDDTCPQGETCTMQDGGAGVCTVPPCASDRECAPPLSHCDFARSPAVCIQCRSDAECTGTRALCELDPRSNLSNLCVECTLGGGERGCAKAAAGTHCFVTRGSCGCTRPSDCEGGGPCVPPGICADGAAGPMTADGGDRAPERALPAVGGTTRTYAAAGGCGAALGSTSASSGAGCAGLIVLLGAALLVSRTRARRRSGGS